MSQLDFERGNGQSLYLYTVTIWIQKIPCTSQGIWIADMSGIKSWAGAQYSGFKGSLIVAYASYDLNLISAVKSLKKVWNEQKMLKTAEKKYFSQLSEFQVLQAPEFGQNIQQV